MLLGTATGKVGDLVFYRAGGEQRTRTKVTPNNPKTYAQQAQRSRVANVTLMYRALSALLRDTFPTRQSNQTPFNAFAAAALPIAPYLNKGDADEGKFVLMPTLVSKGSLPVPFSEVYADSNGARIEMAFAAAENPTTIQQLAQALIAWRPCCFAEGGALILVVLGSNDDENPGRHIANYIRIPIDTGDNRLLSALDITVTTTQQAGDVNANTRITYNYGGAEFGVAAIIERPKAGGGYDVCDARMVLNSQASQTYDEYTSDAVAMEAAISYGGTQGACVII